MTSDPLLVCLLKKKLKFTNGKLLTRDILFSVRNREDIALRTKLPGLGEWIRDTIMREFQEKQPTAVYELLIKVKDLLDITTSASRDHDAGMRKLKEVRQLYQSLMYKMLDIHYNGIMQTVEAMKFVKGERKVFPTINNQVYKSLQKDIDNIKNNIDTFVILVSKRIEEKKKSRRPLKNAYIAMKAMKLTKTIFLEVRGFVDDEEFFVTKFLTIRNTGNKDPLSGNEDSLIIQLLGTRNTRKSSVKKTSETALYWLVYGHLSNIGRHVIVSRCDKSTAEEVPPADPTRQIRQISIQLNRLTDNRVDMKVDTATVLKQVWENYSGTA